MIDVRDLHFTYAGSHQAVVRGLSFAIERGEIFGFLWPLKVFWLFDEGAVGFALVHASAGIVWQGVLLTLLVRRFSRVVRR